MAELLVSVNAEDTSWAMQDIDAADIPLDAGDTASLSIDLCVLVPDADPGEMAGKVSLWYWYDHEDQMHADSWYVLAETTFSGGVWTRAGTDPLSLEFAIPQHPVEPQWTWLGARLELKAAGPGGKTGAVWADNVQLTGIGPESDFSRWRSYGDRYGDWSLSQYGEGWKTVYAEYQDSTGVETHEPLADSTILDMTAPQVEIDEPEDLSLVSDSVSITGWAYDPECVAADTFFEWRRLYYRQFDSTEWLPVDPDSVSCTAAYPDWGNPVNIAVELGKWNTPGVEDNDYWLILQSADSAGNVAACSVRVTVDNEGEGDGGGGMLEGMATGPEGGVASMGAGSIWLGSRTGHVLHLDEDMAVVDTFCLGDSATTTLVSALMGFGDSLLATDAYSHNLYKSGRRGQNRRSLTTGLGLPAGLVEDGAGNVWLCDRAQSRIARYGPTGGLLFTRGGPDDDSVAQLKNPEGITVRNGKVYVADTRNNRIAVWDTAGEYLASITGDFNGPQAIAVTDQGQMYAIDKRTGVLLGLNTLGERFYAVATLDSSPFRYITMSEAGTHVFTTRPDRNYVLKYRVKQPDTTRRGGEQAGPGNLPRTFVLYQPWPNPCRRGPHIRYGLPMPTEVSLTVYDIAGRATRTLQQGLQKPGYYNLVWDRKDDKGREVAAGVYFARLIADEYQAEKKLVLVK